VRSGFPGSIPGTHMPKGDIIAGGEHTKNKIFAVSVVVLMVLMASMPMVAASAETGDGDDEDRGLGNGNPDTGDKPTQQLDTSETERNRDMPKNGYDK